VKRPDCAGWHEHDPTCDGDDNEPACRYRERCLLLIELAGGREARTVATVNDVRRRHTEKALSARLKAQQLAEAPKVPQPPASFTERVWRYHEPVKVYPRPVELYGHALPIADAISERFARNIGRTFVEESEALKVGDVYLRFLPGVGWRQAVLYLFTGVNAFGLWIARIQLSRDKPQVTVKINCASADNPAAWTPPAGVFVRMWQDRRPMFSLVAVRAEHARDTGRFLADLYKAGQIGKRGSRAKQTP